MYERIISPDQLIWSLEIVQDLFLINQPWDSIGLIIIFYMSGVIYSFKSIPDDGFFWETFHGNFIYSQSFARNLLAGRHRRNICRFSF